MVTLCNTMVVLLVIGWLTPARVGLHALWASVILTLATLFLKLKEMYAKDGGAFAEPIQQYGGRVVQYTWSPVAGGNRRLQRILAALT